MKRTLLSSPFALDSFAPKYNFLHNHTTNDTKRSINTKVRNHDIGSKAPNKLGGSQEFTAGAGQPTPRFRASMTDSEVLFLTKMILDETELMATILLQMKQRK